MPHLVRRHNYGDIENLNPELYRQLTDTYTDISSIVNTKSSKHEATVAPPGVGIDADVNKNYDIGDLWVNKANNTAFIMTSRVSPTDVTWTLIT